MATRVVEILTRANAGRAPDVVREKFDRMAHDVFTFFRGANPVFVARWPEVAPADPGPAVLICGDLHLENFGAYRTEQGAFRYDVNDFDEAVVAPVAIDLARCAASILLAAEEWRRLPTEATGMALAYLESYRATLATLSNGPIGELGPDGGRGPVAHQLGKVAVASREKLLARHTRHDGRRIRRTGRTPALDEATRATVAAAVERHGAERGEATAYEVLDIRGRLAGLGSRGLRRYLVLARGDALPRLFDVKEAAPSAWAGFDLGPQPFWDDEARRVVMAQQALQGHPAAGLGAMAIDGWPFRIREMIPDENRASLDRYREHPRKLRTAVEVAGRLTAWSQARGTRFSPCGDSLARLAAWSAGPGLDAILACAARVADRTNEDHARFRRAVRHGHTGVEA